MYSQKYRKRICSPLFLHKKAIPYLLVLLLLSLSPYKAFAEDIRYSADEIRSGSFILKLPLGLEADKFYIPSDNPMSREKIELGRALYFDERLSRDDTVSCASCHSVDNGFTDNLAVSLGIDGQEGGRSAPTIINRAFSKEQFWDGRAKSLEEQAKGPLTNPIEMGMPSEDAVIKKIASIKGYRKWFRQVFGRDVNIDDLAKAIATFERTVLSGDSRVDRFTAGDKTALTKSEKRGLKLFRGKARCSQCHSGANFTNEKYHNLGVSWGKIPTDMGRNAVTGKEHHTAAFKTPTLRDIDDTAPYMHDGSIETLEGVIDFYDKGGVGNQFLDNEMRRSELSLNRMLDSFEKEKNVKPRSNEGTKLGLTVGERADLVAFMKALSGKGWQNAGAPDSFPK